MMLVDALREDFVLFDKDSDLDSKQKVKKALNSKAERKKAHNHLNTSKSVYKGKKLELFQNLIEE